MPDDTQPELFAAAPAPAYCGTALSIRQPWAWLILHGGKDIENRNWESDFRGRVFIHASKGMTREEYAEGVEFARRVDRKLIVPPFEKLPRGGIVGEVEITGCVTESGSAWFVGSYGFSLKNAQPLAFLPCRGMLGFFKVGGG